ncbi:hypothetical protein BJY00DRAFT_146246 [Aspergillus carlsbadensis]|nr:hypothetical protein BJY00DRAFT_146246 [Aspergillus carlsbadensis]
MTDNDVRSQGPHYIIHHSNRNTIIARYLPVLEILSAPPSESVFINNEEDISSSPIGPAPMTSGPMSWVDPAGPRWRRFEAGGNFASRCASKFPDPDPTTLSGQVAQGLTSALVLATCE